MPVAFIWVRSFAEEVSIKLTICTSAIDSLIFLDMIAYLRDTELRLSKVDTQSLGLTLS